MYLRLKTFLAENKILNNNQFGFRPGLNTSDAIVEFLEHAYTSIDEKKHLIAIFLDLSKAFDTIDHEILLEKLKHIGIKDMSLKWFHSYIVERKQFVVANSHKSGIKSLRYGVPQGSTLGPILFLLYINDFGSAINEIKYIQFADDTTLFNSYYDIGELNTKINMELTEVYRWLTVNKLSLNVSKTKFMIISNRQTPNVNIQIQDINLERLDENKISRCHA